MTNSVPLISVLMSVYNGQNTVEESVRSILSQSFGDFEFIIVDDGSSDLTSQILKSLKAEDARIVLIPQKNAGLTKALNKGARLARGQYIARQDADDIALPDRLKCQVNEFLKNPALVLLGGNSIDEYSDGSVSEWGYWDDQNIRDRVLLCPPFPHASAMFLSRVFKDVGGYDETLRTSQDMDLWMRMARYGQISMLESPVMRRRVHEDSISHKRRWRQYKDALRIRLRHNPRRPFYMLYFSLRSLMIGFMKPRHIQFLKRVFRL